MTSTIILQLQSTSLLILKKRKNATIAIDVLPVIEGQNIAVNVELPKMLLEMSMLLLMVKLIQHQLKMEKLL